MRELGLRGVFVESARKDLLLDAPQARPMLAAAAALGVPVFVHPVTDPAMHNRFKRYGRLGVRLARSTINSAALFALLEGGTFDELPNLRVVVTTLALGGVLLAGGFGDGHRLRRDAPALTRRHVYIDTMGLHPVLVRSAVDLLGADHVLCRHRLADRRGEIDAATAASGVGGLRARCSRAADGCRWQYSQTAGRFMSPSSARSSRPAGKPGSGQIGMAAAVSIGIGGMVGAGIFSILGVVAQAAGNAMWLAFAIGGVVALLSTYSYAKLGADVSLGRRRGALSW